MGGIINRKDISIGDYYYLEKTIGIKINIYNKF